VSCTFIDWIALQIARIGKGESQEASQKDALADVAEQAAVRSGF
jgi:hypothetical protein